MTPRPIYRVGEPVWDMTEEPRAADEVSGEPRWFNGTEIIPAATGTLLYHRPARGFWYPLLAKGMLVHESMLRRRPPPAERSIEDIIRASRDSEVLA